LARTALPEGLWRFSSLLLQGNQLYTSRRHARLFTPDCLSFREHHLLDIGVKVLKVAASKTPKNTF